MQTLYADLIGEVPLLMAQAIFRALDTVKREDWFRQTQVYLYRGAWQVLCAQHHPALCKGLAEPETHQTRVSSQCSSDAWHIAVLMHFSLQEWEPYEADLAVPMTSSDLSLKVTPLPSSHTLQQLHGGVSGSLALLHRAFAWREG